MNPPYSLVKPDAAILNEIAHTVPHNIIGSFRITSLLQAMLQIARDHQGDSSQPTVVGLAAPQIGAPWRIILVDTSADGTGTAPTYRFFIDPVIIATSVEQEDGREGCWSTDRVCGIVARAKKVILESYDMHGSKTRKTYDGFVARILQHEIDHLNGIRFPDRITDDTKLHWVEPDTFGEYRKHWRTWNVPCPRERWLAITRGANTGTAEAQ